MFKVDSFFVLMVAQVLIYLCMRTLDKMRKCRMAKGIDKVKGCVKPPLFEIKPENCVIDELHLFLRISNVLFENLFAELQRLSHRSKTHRTGDPTDQWRIYGGQ